MNYGTKLRNAIAARGNVPFIGIYDSFSATVAAKHYDAFFVSGYGFAASYYGLPDIGFIAWPDIVSFVQRLRTIFPEHHILVDIDDGYSDPEVACHVVKLLENAGASGVVLEDQKRPRRCGHVGGKLLLEPEEYAAKLEKVLATRNDMVVISRTDASEYEDVRRRVHMYAQLDPDALLVDGVRNFEVIQKMHQETGKPFTFNQIAGGKSPPITIKELQSIGVSYVIYSTPLLFTVQNAMEQALVDLKRRGGMLPLGGIGVPQCNAVLEENHERSRPTFGNSGRSIARAEAA